MDSTPSLRSRARRALVLAVLSCSAQAVAASDTAETLLAASGVSDNFMASLQGGADSPYARHYKRDALQRLRRLSDADLQQLNVWFATPLGRRAAVIHAQPVLHLAEGDARLSSLQSWRFAKASELLERTKWVESLVELNDAVLNSSVATSGGAAAPTPRRRLAERDQRAIAEAERRWLRDYWREVARNHYAYAYRAFDASEIEAITQQLESAAFQRLARDLRQVYLEQKRLALSESAPQAAALLAAQGEQQPLNDWARPQTCRTVITHGIGQQALLVSQRDTTSP